MESSRRDLLNDMAQHRPILKSNQNRYHSRFGFTPKTGTAFPKMGFCFYFAHNNTKPVWNTEKNDFIFLPRTFYISSLNEHCDEAWMRRFWETQVYLFKPNAAYFSVAVSISQNKRH